MSVEQRGEHMPALEARARRRTRLTLVLIVILFAAPLTVAYLANFYRPDWRPRGTTNHGELLVPARALATVALTDAQGTALGSEWLQGRWTLLYVAGERCGEVCRQNLYKMRPVRLAQGKNIDRVQRLLVVPGPQALGAYAQARSHYPGLRIAWPEPARRAAFLRQFSIGEGDDVVAAARIYLVDPLGNLMMWYPAGADARGMLRDLERLLKISYVG